VSNTEFAGDMFGTPTNRETPRAPIILLKPRISSVIRSFVMTSLKKWPGRPWMAARLTWHDQIKACPFVLTFARPCANSWLAATVSLSWFHGRPIFAVRMKSRPQVNLPPRVAVLV